MLQMNTFSNFIKFANNTMEENNSKCIKKTSQFDNIKQLYPFQERISRLPSKYSLPPLTNNQRFGARLTPTIDEKKDSKIGPVYGLETRRAIVLWQAVGSKRENRFNISEIREKERERKEGSEASERDKLESGTGERKLPRA